MKFEGKNPVHSGSYNQRCEEDSHNFPKLDQYFYLMFGWLTAWQNMHNMLRVKRPRMSKTPAFLASEAQMYKLMLLNTDINQ